MMYYDGTRLKFDDAYLYTIQTCFSLTVTEKERKKERKILDTLLSPKYKPKLI